MAGGPVKNKTLPTRVEIGIYIVLLLFVICCLYAFLNGFFANLKVLLYYANNSLVINSLINNSNTYLALLQELAVSASMIFGFYAILLFYSVEYITNFINTYPADIHTMLIKAFAFLFMLFPFILILLSASYSITATMIYETPIFQNATIQTDVYNSVGMLFYSIGIVLVNLIISLVVRLCPCVFPKKYHGVDILFFFWSALLLIVFIVF